MYVRTNNSAGMGDTNAQIPVTQNANPQIGFPVCNAAGGYSLVKPSCYQVAVCMTASDLAAAEAQCSAPVVPPPASSGGSGTAPVPVVTTGGGSTGTTAGSASSSGSAAATSPSSIFDSAIAWAEANPMWAAAGAVIVVLLLVKR